MLPLGEHLTVKLHKRQQYVCRWKLERPHKYEGRVARRSFFVIFRDFPSIDAPTTILFLHSRSISLNIVTCHVLPTLIGIWKSLKHSSVQSQEKLMACLILITWKTRESQTVFCAWEYLLFSQNIISMAIKFYPQLSKRIMVKSHHNT